MSAILLSALNYLIPYILSALGGWFMKMLHTYVKDNQRAASDEAKTASATKALQDAETKQELEDAAKNISNNF